MILPSGNTYSISYSGLTNVISRFVHFPQNHLCQGIFCMICDFTWQSSVTWREAPDFLPVFNTICGYETKSAKDPWSVFVVMHAPSLSVIRKTESTSAGTDGHCVPGLPSTASPDINQQSRIVLSLEPQTGYMTFPKVIQSVKNILPEIKCLGTEHSALKQFNKL